MEETCSIEEQAGGVRLTGSLGLYTVDHVRRDLLTRLAQAADLHLDLEGVTACDASGVQLLVAARKSARRAGRIWTIAPISPAIARCAAALGLPEDFVSD